MFLLLASNNYILVKVTSSDKSEFSLKLSNITFWDITDKVRTGT